MEVIRCLANDFIRLVANQCYNSEKDNKNVALPQRMYPGLGFFKFQFDFKLSLCIELVIYGLFV